MSKNVLKALPELVAANVITQDTADKITNYYERQPDGSSNRLVVIFAILGSLLVGFGVILIVAHNWDTFPRFIKLAFGLIPLLAAQGICGYLLKTGSINKGWIEGASVFLTLAVALSIAIVSQVYNIEGDLRTFMLTWMVLTLPIVYAMSSSMTSLIFICGITYYGSEVGYFHYPSESAVYYWILLALIIPFYYLEFIRKGLKNNFYHFHSWLLVISITICLGVVTKENEEFIVMAYITMFSCLIMLGESKLLSTERLITNSYLVVGSLGIISMSLFTTFDFYWESIERLSDNDFINSREFISFSVLFVAAVLLVIWRLSESSLSEMNFKSFAFLLFTVLFFISFSTSLLPQIIANVVVLAFAVNTIHSGAKKNHLGIINYGLLIVTALILCRFLDTDLSFIFRGLLFVAVGAAFFATNYYMIRKRKIKS